MSDKVLSREQLAETLQSRRSSVEKIVFTNGCFDILHVGHARYLAQAKALGDVLVVGVNSDSSVQGLKGPNRPLVPEDERAEMLSHLTSVDYVSIFEESRPDALIEIVRPDIHVKGGDYCGEDLPEAPTVRKHGGQVVILPLVEGRSTSELIAKVIDKYGAP